MKKWILIAFVLSFGVFVLLYASENSMATIFERDKKVASDSHETELETTEITATPLVSIYQERSQQPSQTPWLEDIESTPSVELEIPSPTLSTENTEGTSQTPVDSQLTQEVRISRPKKVLLKPDQTTNFIIYLMPTDITDAKVVFEIEDETIAKLSTCEIPKELKETAGCTITGLKPGRTIVNITVTSEKGNCTDSCIIIVGDDIMWK